MLHQRQQQNLSAVQESAFHLLLRSVQNGRVAVKHSEVGGDALLPEPPIPSQVLILQRLALHVLLMVMRKNGQTVFKHWVASWSPVFHWSQ